MTADTATPKITTGAVYQSDHAAMTVYSDPNLETDGKVSRESLRARVVGLTDLPGAPNFNSLTWDEWVKVATRILVLEFRDNGTDVDALLAGDYTATYPNTPPE